MKMSNIIEAILYIVGILMLAMILLGGPLMLLWNWLMPNIFGLPEITFWQACGLQVLATILFKATVKTNK
jgi:hypothetical protein